VKLRKLEGSMRACHIQLDVLIVAAEPDFRGTQSSSLQVLGTFLEHEGKTNIRFVGHDQHQLKGEFMNWLVYALVWIMSSMGIACLFGRMVQNEVLEYFS